MSSLHPGIMVISRFSLCPLSGMAGTTAKTLAITFVDGFLSGFCFVIFFSRLTGLPPAQAARDISPTRNHRDEKSGLRVDNIITPFVISCFWFFVNCRPPPALEAWLAKVVVLHSLSHVHHFRTYPKPHPHIYITLAPHRLGFASVIHPPSHDQFVVFVPL